MLTYICICFSNLNFNPTVRPGRNNMTVITADIFDNK